MAFSRFSLAAGEVLSAERKISRASSAMERPCWAARTLNLFLVFSSNCRMVSVAISNVRLLAVAAQALSQMLFGTLLLLHGVGVSGCPAC
jgi:hypothetical protein